MFLPGSLVVEDAATVLSKDRRDDGNDNNDNGNRPSSTQTSISTMSGISTTLTNPTSSSLTATTPSVPPPPSPTSTILTASASSTPSSFTLTSSRPFTATPATSTPFPSPSPTPSRTTILRDVAAACAGTAAFVLLLFCVYKCLRRRKSTLDGPADPPSTNTIGTARPPLSGRRIRSQDVSSRLWGSSVSGSTTVEEMPHFVPAMAYNAVSNAVSREERLGLVRKSLLRPQDWNGPLIGLQSQARRGQHLPEGRGNEYSVKGLNENLAGSGTNEWNRVDIEASGQWKAPVTVAARESGIESVLSTPRWRDPVSWVRDQMYRNKTLDG